MNSERKFIILIHAKNNLTYNMQKRVGKWTWIKKDERVFHVYSTGLLGPGEKERNRQTWLRSPDSTKNTNVYAINTDSANNLYCDTVEGWDGILHKSLSAMKYLRENVDFDFLITTNQSTYWNLNNLTKLLQALPLNKVYAGVLEKREYPDVNFIGGSGIIFSKDVVDLLVDNQTKVESDFIEDVSIGRFLNSLGINPYHIARPEVKINLKKLNLIVKNEDIQKTVRLRFVNEILSAVSIRCKDEDHMLLRIRMDPLIIMIIHSSVLLAKKFRVK
jgi:hypothetical protein